MLVVKVFPRTTPNSTLLLLCEWKEESVMPLSPLFGKFFVKWILLETTVSNQNYEVVFFLVLTVYYLTLRKSELKIKLKNVMRAKELHNVVITCSFFKTLSCWINLSLNPVLKFGANSCLNGGGYNNYI